MVFTVRSLSRRIALLVAMTFAATGVTAHATDAQLVHCGAQTCLRLSGNRADAAVDVRVGTRSLAAEGGRHWQVTVPLALARRWRTSSPDALAVTFADVRSGAEHTETVSLPPGALGRHVELVALMVTAN